MSIFCLGTPYQRSPWCKFKLDSTGLTRFITCHNNVCKVKELDFFIIENQSTQIADERMGNKFKIKSGQRIMYRKKWRPSNVSMNIDDYDINHFFHIYIFPFNEENAQILFGRFISPSYNKFPLTCTYKMSLILHTL